jgi:hypothetical protein
MLDPFIPDHHDKWPEESRPNPQPLYQVELPCTAQAETGRDLWPQPVCASIQDLIGRNAECP